MEDNKAYLNIFNFQIKIKFFKEINFLKKISQKS